MVNKYIGIPFNQHGRDFNGCDCWGLVKLYYNNELGINLPCLSSLYEHTQDAKIVGVISNEALNWRLVDVPDANDVAVLSMRGMPFHVGLMTGKRDMLHIEQDINSVIERIDSPIWNSRIKGFYRHISFM